MLIKVYNFSSSGVTCSITAFYEGQMLSFIQSKLPTSVNVDGSKTIHRKIRMKNEGNLNSLN